MKKLLIINHMGEVVLTHDVFLEGQDIHYKEHSPKAVWLNHLLIVDPDHEEEMLAKVRGTLGIEPEFTPIDEPATEEELKEAQEELAAEAVEQVEYQDEPVMCIAEDCGWQGDLSETTHFGHNDWLCPACDSESLKEVTDGKSEESELESLGDQRPSEAKQPKSPKAAPKKSAKRKATK